MELKDISKKRQKKRKDTDLYKVKEDISKPKFYILDMFPYPSGSALHVGHPKGYIATDALARKKMLQGFNVLHPMGFDTFGLGTEQYAIEHKMKPQDVSKQNIAKFISQLENFGTTYDRSRAVNTADPKYFKWTQRVFLQMYNHYYDTKLAKALPIKDLELRIKNGKDLSYLSSFTKGGEPLAGEDLEKFLNSQRLAYVDYKPINRCPKCMTGLANEDLDDGKCERCGSVVEQKPMKQRVLRITKYADRLLEGLDTLKREESMKDLERNWIGKSEGTEFDMNVVVPDKVSKIIILHGITGHDQRHRFQWFKKEMNKQGVEVLIPNLPNTDNPQYIEQLEFLKKEVSDKLDKDTIIIGHSLGCFLGAMFLLETGKKVKKLVSVGPVFEGIKTIKEHPEVGNYVAGIHVDIKELENLLEEHIIFLSKTDPYIDYETVKKYYEKNFSKKAIICFDDKGHFSDKNGNLTEFPELLNYIYSSSNEKFSVYTTRVDTVFGMSFVAIAPEHPLVDKITTKEYLKEVNKYKEAAKHKTQLERTELQKEKTGVFCGAYAINPFNGEKVKIFVADYVLANYGTGVVMAVPAHDERDFEFAKKYDLPIKHVIGPIFGQRHDQAIAKESGYAVFYDKEKDALLVGTETLNGHKYYRIPGGTIEEGEDIISGTIREVEEETGFHDMRYVDDICCVQNFYFAHSKNVRRENNAKYLLFELNSDKTKPKKLTIHEKDCPIEWIPYNEVVRSLDDMNDHMDAFDGKRKGFRFVLEMIKKNISGAGAYTEKGMLFDSGEFSGMESDEAIKKMQAWLEKQGIGGVKVNYKMQDRVFSRQRYRGEPFPILRDETGNIVALDEHDLPLLLPDVENYEPTGTEEGPLAAITDWVNVTKDGKKYKRETNTMPGRAGSSRYRLRYMDVNNEKELVGKDKENYRGNVDVYVGGAEHVTRHMIYARFRQKFLFDIGVVTKQEPFEEYHYVGLIMGEDGRKMSKRRGNVVNPDDIINEFGTDVLRSYEMFMGPFDQSIAWSTNGIKGVKKFLEKVITLKDKISDNEETNETKTLLNQSIKKLTDDIDGFRFNTAISQLMILVNHLTDCKNISRRTFEDLVVLVSPFAPHLAEELREGLGNDYSVFTKATWPKYDEKCLVADTITIGVQVNGKMRGTICISKDAEQNEALQAANSDEKIKSRITSEPKKVIYVKGKILNIVV